MGETVNNNNNDDDDDDDDDDDEGTPKDVTVGIENRVGSTTNNTTRTTTRTRNIILKVL